MVNLFNMFFNRKKNSSAVDIMQIKRYDKIQLTNGKTGYIYDIVKPGKRLFATIFEENHEQKDRYIPLREIECVFPRPEYTVEQRRALTTSAILMGIHVGAYGIRRFGIPDDWGFTVEHAKDVIGENWWGIYDKAEAIKTMEYLSVADGHAPVANEIFKELIAKGRMEPLGMEKDFDEILEKTADASFNRAQSGLPEFLEANSIPEEQEQVEGAFNYLARVHYVNRINHALENYPKAIKWLLRYGYTKDELKNIDNFSAWDYGRCGFVAQHAHKCGYITEDDAWEYMLTAGANAAKDYQTWRGFLAAYFIGRFLVYDEEGIKDFNEHADYLLNHPYSVYNDFPLNVRQRETLTGFAAAHILDRHGNNT
jgi:hypothetical protein